MGRLGGYQYRKKITLTNSSGNTYTNIVVELVLTNEEFSGAQTDGSDIVFTDIDGTTILPFWREYYGGNSSGDPKVFWVKIPYIGASREIFVYWGNSTATDYSDLSSIADKIESFEDGYGYFTNSFNSDDDWSSITTEDYKSGMYSLKFQANTTETKWSNRYSLNGTFFDEDYKIILVFFKGVSMTHGSGRILVYRNGILFTWIDFFYNGTLEWQDGDEVRSGSYTLNEWYRMAFFLNDIANRYDLEYFNEDYSIKTSSTDLRSVETAAPSDRGLMLGAYSLSGSVYFDLVISFPYGPGITYTVGALEDLSGSIAPSTIEEPVSVTIEMYSPTIKLRHDGRPSTLKFTAPQKYDIDTYIDLQFNHMVLFRGRIVKRKYRYMEDVWEYEALPTNHQILNTIIKSKPSTWRNVFPEELIAEILRYHVGYPGVVVPSRGWYRTPIVYAERVTDTSDYHEGNDTYSYKFAMGVDRYGYPLSAIVSRYIYSTSGLYLKGDYGSGTGKIVLWKFGNGYPELYYTSVTTWSAGFTNYVGQYTKVTIIEFGDSKPRTGSTITLSSALDNTQSDRSDIMGFAYPSMTPVPISIDTAGTSLRVKWYSSTDDKLIIVYGGESTIVGNIGWSEALPFSYTVPSTSAGGYELHHFHLVGGTYTISMDNSSGGDDVTVTIDNSDDMTWTLSNGDTLDEEVSLGSGKHEIKIELGASYSGGFSIDIVPDDVSGYGVTTYTDSDVIEALEDMELTDVSVVYIVEDSAPGAPDLVTLWIDGVYEDQYDEIVREIDAKSKTFSSILNEISNMGYLIGYDDRGIPVPIHVSDLSAYTIPGYNVIDLDLTSSLENYVSRVTVYGSSRDISYTAALDNPIIHRDIVLNLPWISSDDEARRYAEMILLRYSLLREIGTVKLAGIYPQFRVPLKIVIDHPLVSDVALEVRTVEYDIEGGTTRLELNVPIWDMIDWWRKSYERLSTDISITCPQGCQSTCMVGCETAQENLSCDETCMVNCQAECETDCLTSCEKGTSCLEDCEVGCEASCQESCMEPCQVGCEDACQNQCEKDCQIECMVVCMNPCQNYCQVARQAWLA